MHVWRTPPRTRLRASCGRWGRHREPLYNGPFRSSGGMRVASGQTTLPLTVPFSGPPPSRGLHLRHQPDEFLVRDFLSNYASRARFASDPLRAFFDDQSDRLISGDVGSANGSVLAISDISDVLGVVLPLENPPASTRSGRRTADPSTRNSCPCRNTAANQRASSLGCGRGVTTGYHQSFEKNRL